MGLDPCKQQPSLHSWPTVSLKNLIFKPDATSEYQIRTPWAHHLATACFCQLVCLRAATPTKNVLWELHCSSLLLAGARPCKMFPCTGSMHDLDLTSCSCVAWEPVPMPNAQGDGCRRCCRKQEQYAVGNWGPAPVIHVSRGLLVQEAETYLWSRGNCQEMPVSWTGWATAVKGLQQPGQRYWLFRHSPWLGTVTSGKPGKGGEGALLLCLHKGLLPVESPWWRSTGHTWPWYPMSAATVVMHFWYQAWLLISCQQDGLSNAIRHNKLSEANNDNANPLLRASWHCKM